jgi:diphthamide biosynthesis methyltransferase
MAMNDERLVVVGPGIRTVGQMTMESIAWIKKADRVLYITSEKRRIHREPSRYSRSMQRTSCG